MNLRLVSSYQFHIPKNFKNKKLVQKIKNVEQRKVQKLTKIFDVCKQHAQDDLSYLREVVKEVKEDMANSSEKEFDEKNYTPQIIIENEVDDDDFFEK